LAAAALAYLWVPSGVAEAVTIFVILYFGLWLREVNYAYWACAMTLILAMLSRSNDTSTLGLLGARLEAILAGALCAVAAAWFVFPIRTEAVVRRRLADALAAFDELVAHAHVSPAEATAKHGLFEWRMAELESVAPPVRWHERVFVRGDVPEHPARWIELASGLGSHAGVLRAQGGAAESSRGKIRRAITASRRAIANHGKPDAPATIGSALRELHVTLAQTSAPGRGLGAVSIAEATEAIVVDRLVKRYGDVEAVAGLSFSVPRGAIFGLLGRNGAGKTTTLECCIGLGKPTSGSVKILGLDPTLPRELAALRPQIGVQLQSTSLPEKAAVGEVLELYAAYYGVPPRAAEMASRVGLEGKLDRQIAQMSGGEQQRLALALALQHDPEVVFLDEPTAGMDAFGRRIFWAEVEALRKAGKTIVLTTHYIEEAERLCDTICVVQRGKIVAEDTPENLVTRYGGDATVCITADGFSPDDALRGLGTWTQAKGEWQLVTRGEPGLALAAVVTHANTISATVRSLDMHRPELEDAFIAITGETIGEGE
jgi:ABC-2 type transport system ATP-binding protein